MSDESPLLNSNQIFGSSDFKIDYVDVPEWGGRIRVRGLSGEERTWSDRVSGEIAEGKATGQAYSACVVACGVIDEQGAAVFGRGDAVRLARKSYAVLERIALKILDLSGATVRAREDLEKN